MTSFFHRYYLMERRLVAPDEDMAPGDHPLEEIPVLAAAAEFREKPAVTSFK
ncbi:MAG: hypothetical protein IMZ61_02610 [Planctomycetes bacterium]|nr:hypothetical protein [Planctomycetota bacterium]